MCSAARCAVRNAKQKKAVPAKNSEANFWRPGTQGPLRAGKRANANFACPEGFSAPNAPRRLPGRPFSHRLPLLCGILRPVFWRFFRRCAAALSPACGLSDASALGLVCAAAACHALVRAFFLLSFAFFCLTFASQNSFHLSLRPRQASTFFRKESRQRFARGRGAPPSNPHSCALRPIFFSSALLAGLVQPFGPQTAG